MLFAFRGMRLTTHGVNSESEAVLPTGSQAVARAAPNLPESRKEQLKSLAKAVLDFAPVRRAVDLPKHSAQYRRLLNRALPSWLKFRGVFSSFAEAQSNLPAGARIGYDHDEIAGIYKGYANWVLSGDYPVLLWLHQILQTTSTVFDFGGNLGISFFAFQNYIPYPKNLVWTVCDLPAVIRGGEKFAEERNERRVRFTERFDGASDCEVLLASGSLMYVQRSLSDMMRGLTRLPRHLLINRTAVHGSRACVTLQNIRWMVAPYHVFERSSFVNQFEALGYTLVDEWLDATHSCWIPFYPENSVQAYSGFYFRRS